MRRWSFKTLLPHPVQSPLNDLRAFSLLLRLHFGVLRVSFVTGLWFLNLSLLLEQLVIETVVSAQVLGVETVAHDLVYRSVVLHRSNDLSYPTMRSGDEDPCAPLQTSARNGKSNATMQECTNAPQKPDTNAQSALRY
jgi:hypothetical protein